MFSRAKIASLVTVLALGALAAVALASGSGGADPAAVQTRDDQPEVRTEVVRQTVHRRARSRDVGARSAAATASRGRSSSTPASRSVELGDDRGRRDGGHAADDGVAHDAFDDHGRDDDGAAHDAVDDRGRGADDGAAHDAVDDHGGGSNSGPGSSGSGRDDSGHGGDDD